MTRILKWIAIFLGAAIGLLVLGAAALLLWVDPNDYRDELEQLAERELGRSLEIAGPLDLKLFPWLSLEVRQVALGNPPGFGKDPFVQVERVRVGVRLMPLLRRRIEVSRVALDGLAATLITRADGRSNWDDLGNSEEKPEGTGSAPETSIAGLDLVRGALLYRNDVDKSLTRLREVELHTGALGGTATVPLDLTLTLDEGEGTDATRLALQAVASVRTEVSRIELADMRLDGERQPAPEPGVTEPPAKVPFEVTAPRLALDYGAGTLEPAQLSIHYGGIPLQANVRGEQLFDARLITGEFTLPRLSPRESLPALGVELPQTPPGTLESFEARGALRLTEKELELSRLTVTLDATQISGNVAIEDLDAETPALGFDVQIDQLDLDRYFPPEPEQSGGTGAASASKGIEEPTELPRDALAALRARGAVRIASLGVAGLAFREVATSVDAREGLVRLGPSTAQLFGGSYRGMMTLDVRPRPARLSLDERVRNLDVGALLQSAMESRRLSGRLDGGAALNARGDTDAALLKTLAGRADFDIRDGALEGLDLWYELRRARALWKREAPPQRSGPPRTAFNALRGSAVLDAGLMRTDDLQAQTDYLKVRGTGTVDVATLALDYRLTAEVYEIPPEGAGAEMAAVRAAEIPLTITGTLAEPKVRPDFDVLVKQRVKQEVEKKVEEKVREKLGDELGDKLKGLFGR